jgi:23S rRNA pseudouridine2605 synthase
MPSRKARNRGAGAPERAQVRSERLHKLLARRGLASRREAEMWIRTGRVRVNGSVVRELGVKVTPDADLIEVDGAPIPAEAPPITIVLNKPAGYVTTVRDRHAEHTVMELVIGLRRRVYPVGRLDRDSRGVLLLTDDGDLAHALLHPAGGVEKVYRVTAAGRLGEAELALLASGVELDDGPTAPARVWGVIQERGKIRFRLALREGRKRQVRRMVRAVGGRIVDLERIVFAGLTARGLPEGSWRILSRREVEGLRRAAAGHASQSGLGDHRKGPRGRRLAARSRKTNGKRPPSTR